MANFERKSKNKRIFLFTFYAETMKSIVSLSTNRQYLRKYQKFHFILNHTSLMMLMICWISLLQHQKKGVKLVLASSAEFVADKNHKSKHCFSPFVRVSHVVKSFICLPLFHLRPSKIEIRRFGMNYNIVFCRSNAECTLWSQRYIEHVRANEFASFADGKTYSNRCER